MPATPAPTTHTSTVTSVSNAGRSAIPAVVCQYETPSFCVTISILQHTSVADGLCRQDILLDRSCALTDARRILDERHQSLPGVIAREQCNIGSIQRTRSGAVGLPTATRS